MPSAYPGCRILIRQALQRGGVPEEAVDICMASITNSTIKQYNSGLKFWWQYCEKQNINVFSITVEHLLTFLTYHFKKGSSYGTLNSFRSAVGQIAGKNILDDFRVKRFFKGVYGLRPNLPKYDMTWDPSVVLSYLENQPTQNVTVESLTQKLTTLLLLATGQRVQTIANIECCNIQNVPEGVNIKIPAKLKTSAKNRSQPNITIPFFKNKKLCVATTLKTYLSKTEQLRGPKTNNLFITLTKPYKNASSQTIARWVKKVLKDSGIDTNIFTAHSTRHAATSAAARKGVNIDTIRLSAGWSKNSKTFAMFYKRPLNSNNFAKEIIDS